MLKSFIEWATKIHESVKSISVSQTAVEQKLETLTSALLTNVSLMKKITLQATARDRKFSQLLAKEYAEGPHDIVYAFLYLNKLTMSDRKLTLVAADTFEKASEIADVIMKKEHSQSLENWVIEGYDSISISKNTEKPSEVNVDLAASLKIETPITTYVSSLQLARDRFAKSKTEKVVLNTLINRIKEEYAGRSK